MTAHECLQLAERYLEDTRALVAAGRYAGAAYVCGYVLEMALKAWVCKHLKQPHYPTTGKAGELLKTHDYETMELFAGLTGFPQNQGLQLKVNWSKIAGWKPEHRYDVTRDPQEREVRALLNALEDRRYGVFTWLKNNFNN